MIGKTAYIKFGTFHGHMGTIVGEARLKGHDRYLIKLRNGLIIPKKVKDVVLFGEVQKNDNNLSK